MKCIDDTIKEISRESCSTSFEIIHEKGDKMKRNDDTIISLLQNRDETAFEMIQTKYGRLIKAVAFNVYRSDTVAEECLNDTLLSIWDTIPPKQPESISAYAVTISKRKAIDRVKSATAKKRMIPEAEEYSEMLDELAFAEDIADAVVDRIELGRILSEFLRTLSSKNREIFMRRYFDVESVNSISANMHISKNALNVRLSRMRRDLAKKLCEEVSK